MSDALPVSPCDIVLPSGLTPKTALPAPTTTPVVAVGKSQDTVGNKVFPPARRSPKRRLKPTQEAFIDHYTDPASATFGNGKQSYLKVHPGVTQGTAGVLASNTLDNANVQAAVRENIERLGFSRDDAIEGLVWNIQTSQAQGKLSDHREGTKVYLQATGNWQDKSEVKHVDETMTNDIRRQVSQQLTALGSN